MAGPFATLASDATGTVPAAAGADHVLRFEGLHSSLVLPFHQDYMLLRGLRESIYWLSWIITLAAITVFVVVFAAKIIYLFEFSSVGVLFLIIYAYSLSLITMAFALSTLFSKRRTAVSVSTLLMLLFSLAVIPIELLHLSTPICAFLALFSPAGFAMATNVIVRAEGRGRRIHILDSRGQRNFWQQVWTSMSIPILSSS